MASMSTYLANKLLDHEWGKATYTPPATYYLCLLKQLPTPAATGSTISEVAYTNYVRKSFTAANLAAALAQNTSNAAVLTFATCGTTGDSAQALAVCDASSGGNLLRYGPLPQALPIVAGVAPSFAAGALNFTVG